MTATPLLRLYQLLWEEIKDEDYVPWLTRHTSKMEVSGIIHITEENALDDDICKNDDGDNNTIKSKAFVLRRIEELKTENQ